MNNVHQSMGRVTPTFECAPTMGNSAHRFRRSGRVGFVVVRHRQGQAHVGTV